MKISIKGIKFIKSFEEFRSRKYLCSAGKRSIGYGHLLKPREDYEEITKSEAIQLLKKDLEWAEKSVWNNISLDITQNQFDALVSFVFNVGGAAFQRSSLRQKINHHADESEIYDEFIRWVYAGGKKSLGLLRRRKMEAAIFLS